MKAIEPQNPEDKDDITVTVAFIDLSLYIKITMFIVKNLENREILKGGSDNCTSVYLFPVVFFMNACINYKISTMYFTGCLATCRFH